TAAVRRRARGRALRAGDRRPVSGARAPAAEVDPAADAREERREPQRVGVVGLGYWGPNLARNLAAIPGCELRWLCDPRPEARARAERAFAGARVTGELSELLEDPALDAVLLATPVPTHAELAASVLQAGKHCFVEKPLATRASEAERVVSAATRTGKTLMVGHLLEFHPAVGRLAEPVGAG